MNRAVLLVLTLGLLSVGCGDDDAKVEKKDAATAIDAGRSDAGHSSEHSPPGALSEEALLAGVCGVQLQAPDPSQCRGLTELLECSRSECGGFEACAEVCREYLECVTSAEDPCIASFLCDSINTEECHSCQMQQQLCIWFDRCTDKYVCGMTVEGGSCEKLEACCQTQTSPAACSGWVELQKMTGGDVSCQMLIEDPGFVEAYASDPPCTF